MRLFGLAGLMAMCGSISAFVYTVPPLATPQFAANTLGAEIRPLTAVTSLYFLTSA